MNEYANDATAPPSDHESGDAAPVDVRVSREHRGHERSGREPGDVSEAREHEHVDLEPVPDDPLDVETLVVTLEAVTAERDSHLADLQRVSAEFANFRKQSSKRQSDMVTHAASGLAEKLLPVLDACEAALSHGADDVAPIHNALLDVLRRAGLETVEAAGEVFDPERHEAVMHEPADDSAAEPQVAEVLRTGYAWNGRVLRPAMVRVRG